MPLEGEYEPSTQKWVRDQVERYARSSTTTGISRSVFSW